LGVKTTMKRKYTPYVLNTWEKLWNPLAGEKNVSAALEVTVQSEELAGILTKIGKNVEKLHAKALIKHHVKILPTGQACRKSLANIFRVFGHKILPSEFLGNLKNHTNFIRNCCVLFTSGKGTPIWSQHLTHSIDVQAVTWLQYEQNKPEKLAQVLIWITNQLFWRLLKSYFHPSETANLRNELAFFTKSHFQGLLESTFNRFLQEKRLRLMTPEKMSQISSAFPFVPSLARCRLLPKKNLSSVRLIARREKMSGPKSDLETELRLLLDYASKKLFPSMVDVKGTYFKIAT
jgi:hypothetical protein